MLSIKSLFLKLSFVLLILSFYTSYNIVKAAESDTVAINKEIVALKAANNYEKAIDKAKQLVKIEEKKNGIAHKDYASALHVLGRLMYEDGSYSEAEPVLKQALSIDEKVLDSNHPNIVRDLKILAELYYTLVRFEEADRLTARANKIASK